MTHKERMLNAYRGIHSDFIPVAPEFWYYYPAKVLGVSMVELQREIPHWKAMRETALKFDAETWCIAGPRINNPHISGESKFEKLETGRYRDRRLTKYGGRSFVGGCSSAKGIALESSVIFDDHEPCWIESYPVKTEKELEIFMNAELSEEVTYDFKEANDAWVGAREDTLVELWLGVAFFDFINGAMGFEDAIMYFMSDNDKILSSWLERYIAQHIRLLREIAAHTKYEAICIGCGASCNSLLGPTLWRKWDKPFLKAVTDEAHKLGLLVHHHNHGKIMETVPDLVEIGFDCVCPFEREPGDVIGIEGLRKVRALLNDKITFNGNVSTIAALINGTSEDVRQEVREIKEAFQGTPRLIIGTGDQVGGETPEENIYAMIDESRR